MKIVYDIYWKYLIGSGAFFFSLIKTNLQRGHWSLSINEGLFWKNKRLFDYKSWHTLKL